MDKLINKFKWFLCDFIFKEVDMNFIATFFINQILSGYLEFWQIPNSHKAKPIVRQRLIDAGMEELIVEKKPE